MNELMLSNQEGLRINSVDLVDIINQFRQLESELIEDKKYKELRHRDFTAKIKRELKTLETLGLSGVRNFKESSYRDSQGRAQPCYSLDSQGVKYIMDSCRCRDKIALANVFNSMSNGEEISICKNKPEYEFIGGIIHILKQFGIKEFKTQYPVKNSKNTNYRIDLYLPELNVAIEYDENNHKGYTYEQQEGRQKYIKNKLCCTFIRVSDKNDIFYNIGYVLRELSDSLNLRNHMEVC